MEQKLRKAIKEAMISKKENPNMVTSCILQTRKNILETAQKVAKDQQKELTETMLIDAAKKEIKQLNDLLGFCKDNVEKQKEIDICITEAKQWLPIMVSKEEIIEEIDSTKIEFSTMGTMMKHLKEKFGDKLDGKMASLLVKERL